MDEYDNKIGRGRVLLFINRVMFTIDQSVLILLLLIVTL